MPDLRVFWQNGCWQAQLVGAAPIWRCAVGRSGAQLEKREGDGVTPVGRWPFRRLLYRNDRLAQPGTSLPSVPITRVDGWCDAPDCASYNQLVQLPHSGSHEVLWRDDHVYDLLVVLGHNDSPVVRGAGSAIFLHLARANFEGTEGCVALQKEPLLEVLSQISPGDGVVIEDPGLKSD